MESLRESKVIRLVVDRPLHELEGIRVGVVLEPDLASVYLEFWGPGGKDLTARCLREV